MIHARKGLVFAVGALILSAAQAQVATKDCTGCSTAQIEALASNCSNGYSYITDFSSQNLYKVCFTWDVNDEYNPPRREKDYDWATPESSAMQLFQAYEGVYLNNGHVKAASAHVRVWIQAPVHVGDDGYYMNANDVLHASADRNTLDNYLQTYNFTNNTIDGQPNTALAAALAKLIHAIPVSSVIKVDGFAVSFVMDFHDGSHVTEAFNSLTGHYEPVQGTYIDGHQNTIPDNSDMPGAGGGQTYGFNGGNSVDMPNMITQLRNLGIPVTSGGGDEIGCSSVDGTVSCRIYHQF